MDTVVIVLAVVAVAAVTVWFVVNRRDPERAARHESHVAETTSERFYDGADRPAGPDAETMDPDRLGGDHRPPGGRSADS